MTPCPDTATHTHTQDQASVAALVSVVIPMYNARSWIEETLASVAHQTFPLNNIELIVVDDASQDGSTEFAEAFITAHSLPGRVIRCERNAGVSAARNRGWRIARGEWVQFLDSDDLLAPHKLDAQTRHALHVPAEVAVVYSDWQHFMLEDDAWQSGALEQPAVDDDPVLRILQDFWFGYVGPTLIRRSALESVDGFDERLSLGEDVDLMLRMAMAGAAFSKADAGAALFFYRDTPDSLWRVAIRNAQSTRDLAQVFRRVEVFLRQQSPDGLSLDARQALANRYLRCLYSFGASDSHSISQTIKWISGLGHPYPAGTGSKLRLVSTAIGYEHAQRLHFSIRRARSWLRARRSA